MKKKIVMKRFEAAVVASDEDGHHLRCFQRRKTWYKQMKQEEKNQTKGNKLRSRKVGDNKKMLKQKKLLVREFHQVATKAISSLSLCFIIQ